MPRLANAKVAIREDKRQRFYRVSGYSIVVEIENVIRRICQG